MSLYLNQIEQLIALQKIDNVIYDVDKLLKKAPLDLEELKTKFDQLDAQKKNVEEKLEHLHEQEKRLATELEFASAGMKKSKAKLDQVENDRELDAASREIDNMENKNKTFEDEQAALASELLFQNTRLEDILELWKEAEENYKEAEENLSVLVKDSEIQITALEEDRRNALAHIPAPVLSRYEFIRRRLKHPVIVPVKEGVCKGCHISIPPQAYNELQRGQQIVSCPNCQRLIYWAEHFKTAEEEVQEIMPAGKEDMVFGEDLI